MSSHKRSARAKQRADFESSLSTNLDDMFAKETHRREEEERIREAHRRYKACESKNRYISYDDALQAQHECEAHGRYGLHIYRCEYCKGWHLTSKNYNENRQ